MKKAFRILSLLATGLAVVGCQDFENGFSAQEIKNAEYAAHFEKVFGTPDPNQDWSMATLVKANVNLPGLTGTAKMNICTGDPRNSETRLLAQIMLKDGKGSIDFDAIKGSDNVFVTVEQDGEYKVFSQYALQNGMLNIGDITPEMLLASAPMTRGFSGSCPTTQSTTGNYLVNAEYATYQVVTGSAITYNSDTKTYDEWIASATGKFDAQNGTTYYPFTDASVRHFVKVNGIDWVNSSLVLKSSATLNTETLLSWNSTSKSADDWQTSVCDSWQTKLNGWQNPSLFETSSIKFSSNGNIDWAGSSLVLKDGAQFSTEEYIIDQWGNGKSKSYHQEQGDQFANNIKNHWSNPTPWTYESFVFNDNGTIDWTNCTYVLQDGYSRCNAGDGIAWSQYGQPKFTLVSTTKSDAETSLASLKADWGNPSPWEDSFAFTEAGAIDWSNSTLTLRTGASETLPGEVITYNSQTKTIAEWKADAENSLQAVFQYNTYNGPWENSSLEPDAEDCEPNNTWPCIFKEVWPTSHWELKTEGVENVPTYGSEHVKVQYLDGVEKAPAESWDAMLGNSFFGANAFFAEGIEYYSTQKVGKYYQESELPMMEAGYKIHTDGPTTIDMPYIFGCTSYANQFGYVYWSDTEAADPNFNPLALKHFVLIEDARPGKNITYIDNQTSTATAITGSEFSKDRWPSLVSLERQYVGTTYRPMFFGSDRNTSKGTYEFPANYNIVFFISTLTRSGDSDGANTLLFTDHNPHGVETSFNYSDPNLNKMLEGHETTKRTGEKNGMVKCITWSNDGNTYMGFGDNCGDEDLNDMVFLIKASGNITTNDLIKVAPIKWHLNYNEKHHDGTNGTTKDDDLHDIYSLNINAEYTQPTTNPTRAGYTFMGWATDPTGTPSMTINGTVADESGACYFAIWEPVGESVKIRWHLNYGGEHIELHNGEDGHDVYATNTVAKSTGTYNKPSTNPTRSGYTFLGWAIEPDATEPDAFTGDNPADATAGESDVCYYALWEPLGDPDPDPQPITWILACEDLGGSFDYDFNDVVWSVQTSWSGGTPTTKVKVLAAGGTLGFALKYKETLICNKGNAFTASTTDEQVVNAGASNGVNRTPNEFTLTTAITTISTEWQEFSVVVKDHGGSQHVVQNIKKSTENSKAPQIILLPEEWEWPTELTPINEAYTNFTTWVTNNTAATWENWRTNKVENKTVSRSATHN